MLCKLSMGRFWIFSPWNSSGCRIPLTIFAFFMHVSVTLCRSLPGKLDVELFWLVCKCEYIAWSPNGRNSMRWLPRIIANYLRPAHDNSPVECRCWLNDWPLASQEIYTALEIKRAASATPCLQSCELRSRTVCIFLTISLRYLLIFLHPFIIQTELILSQHKTRIKYSLKTQSAHPGLKLSPRAMHHWIVLCICWLFLFWNGKQVGPVPVPPKKRQRVST